MRGLSILVVAAFLAAACGGGGEGGSAQGTAAAGPTVEFDQPEPLEVPAARTVASDTDWEARVHNKEIEVLQVINIINPVAAFITAAFEQYGPRFSEVLQEEWTDTQEQLTKAMTLYDSCNERKAANRFNKQLFLDMEEVWQLLVKTGVAGVRTQSMVNQELASFGG